MSDEITVVDATEALEPPPTGAIYAWGAEDDFIVAAGQPDPPATGARSVVAVAVLAVFAAIAAVTAGVVVLLTPMRTDHYDLRPLPVQAAPAPLRQRQRQRRRQRHPRQQCRHPWWWSSRPQQRP